MKDSGQRAEFDTGARRDTDEGKGWWHLLPYLPLLRWAEWLRLGARKYGKNNWRKGIPLSRYIDGAYRHLAKLAEGWKDEDHAAAILFNAGGFIYTVDAIERGELPRTLDDIGWFGDPSPTENVLPLMPGGRKDQ